MYSLILSALGHLDFPDFDQPGCDSILFQKSIARIKGLCKCLQTMQSNI